MPWPIFWGGGVILEFGRSSKCNLRHYRNSNEISGFSQSQSFPVCVCRPPTPPGGRLRCLASSATSPWPACIITLWLWWWMWGRPRAWLAHEGGQTAQGTSLEEGCSAPFQSPVHTFPFLCGSPPVWTESETLGVVVFFVFFKSLVWITTYFIQTVASWSNVCCSQWS